MTNNEVIIDGVDVSECRFYQNTGFCLILDNCLWCHDEKQEDCYYKELQRKTQECEKMKEEIKQIKKDLRKRFSVQNVPDGDIIITCSKKQPCYELLHAYEAMTAYCEADKKRAKYKSALDEIEEFCLVYRDNPVEGSAYKKILDIITKAKEQE